jgi:hypothetical protein
MRLERWILVASTSLVACGPGASWWEADGADEAELAQNEAALVSEDAAVAEDGVQRCTDLTPEELAQRAASNAGNRFSPADCVTATASGATVTYQLNHCSGRRGRLDVTGTITVTFSELDGVVKIETAAQGLQLARGTFDVNATATCAVQADDRRLWTVTSNSSGTNLSGIAVSHSGNWTLLVDRATQCVELDGTWIRTAGSRERTTTITDLVRCDGHCPAAGGEIQVEGERGTLTVTFDGSSTATWTSSSGTSGTRTMACTP